MTCVEAPYSACAAFLLGRPGRTAEGTRIMIERPLWKHSWISAGPARFLFILLALGAVFAAAPSSRSSDEPWKGKSYQQWDENDLKRIFTESPWVRQTTITRNWLPITPKEDVQGAPISGRDRPMPSDVDHSSETSVGGALNFYVFWASSHVMRAASARKAILHGGNSSVDVDKYANAPQSEYQLAIQSADMTPFRRQDEKYFQENSYLQMKKTKLKISPSHVVYERSDSAGPVIMAVFFFPKTASSGVPTITPDEKSVEFSCKIGGSYLRVSFDLQKMTDRSGPDL